MAATFLIVYLRLPRWAIQRWLLPALAWFGFFTAIVAVLAYYGSPGKILWMLPSPYPDVWGPFLSRNHFAQFLELCFPVALWLWSPPRLAEARGAAKVSSPIYGLMALVMLSAGFASSSRAGAVLLSAELIGFAALKIRSDGLHPIRTRRIWTAGVFLAGFLLLAAIAGGGRVLDRFAEANPFAMRLEIFRSSAEMINERPFRGYGLGTFADVYPAFAYFDSGQRVTHAHNDWLEWTAGGGVGFLAAWVLLGASLASSAFRHFWGVGVIAVLLHALVDYPFATLGIALWVLFLAGALEKNRSDALLPQRRTV